MLHVAPRLVLPRQSRDTLPADDYLTNVDAKTIFRDFLGTGHEPRL